MKSETVSFTTIDEYISLFPENVRQKLSELRQTIREEAPQAVEKISYRMPAFYLNGNLVYFAAFKNHIGFYPTSGGIEAVREELSGYKFAKGSIRFPVDKPLPIALVRKIVQLRVKQNSGKK